MDGHTTIAVTTAAVVACTFVFLTAYLNHKPSSSNCITTSIPSPKHHTPAAVKGERGRRRRVRFAGVKEIKAGRERKSDDEKKQKGENLPENWRRLYTGINRYRSQQATKLIYT